MVGGGNPREEDELPHGKMRFLFVTVPGEEEEADEAEGGVGDVEKGEIVDELLDCGRPSLVEGAYGLDEFVVEF